MFSLGKVDFYEQRHKEKISGKHHEEKQMDESWEMLIQHHSICLLSVGPIFSTRWGWWGRCGRFWPKEKMANNDWWIRCIISATRTEAGACSEYCSVNCNPERKMAIGNDIPITTVIETDTLVTHALLHRCWYEDKTKQTKSHD